MIVRYKYSEELLEQKGILSLWRGNTPTVLAEGGVTALNFVFRYKVASNNVLQYYPSLQKENGGDRKRRILQSFVSGGMAGATTITFLCPLVFFCGLDWLLM